LRCFQILVGSIDPDALKIRAPKGGILASGDRTLSGDFGAIIRAGLFVAVATMHRCPLNGCVSSVISRQRLAATASSAADLARSRNPLRRPNLLLYGRVLLTYIRHDDNLLLMLKRTNVYLNTNSLKVLKRLGEKKGGLRPAQMIRIAIREFIDREASKEKRQ